MDITNREVAFVLRGEIVRGIVKDTPARSGNHVVVESDGYLFNVVKRCLILVADDDKDYHLALAD